MNIHDSGYKFLFSMVAFFRQLVETFVEETWVKQLDFSRATLLDKSFVSADLRKLRSGPALASAAARSKPIPLLLSSA